MSLATWATDSRGQWVERGQLKKQKRRRAQKAQGGTSRNWAVEMVDFGSGDVDPPAFDPGPDAPKPIPRDLAH
jgi:hypothetical protein